MNAYNSVDGVPLWHKWKITWTEISLLPLETWDAHHSLDLVHEEGPRVHSDGWWVEYLAQSCLRTAEIIYSLGFGILQGEKYFRRIVQTRLLTKFSVGEDAFVTDVRTGQFQSPGSTMWPRRDLRMTMNHFPSDFLKIRKLALLTVI